jgi:hypothetical protein
MNTYTRDSVTSNERNRLSAERADVILKAVVKRFFNEKEVTSTLVMDALYSGCRALQTRATGGSGAHAGDVVMSVEHNEAHLAGDALRCASGAHRAQSYMHGAHLRAILTGCMTA